MSTQTYTERQGQVLAFIHYYTLVMGVPPAQSDLQKRFAVTPAAVHQMVVTLEKRGLLERTRGAARALRVLLRPDELPELTELPGLPLVVSPRGWVRTG